MHIQLQERSHMYSSLSWYMFSNLPKTKACWPSEVGEQTTFINHTWRAVLILEYHSQALTKNILNSMYIKTDMCCCLFFSLLVCLGWLRTLYAHHSIKRCRIFRTRVCSSCEIHMLTHVSLWRFDLKSTNEETVLWSGGGTREFQYATTS
jgi:hypothetical protein